MSFWLSVCPVTGDPGCMDCIEGQCPGGRLPPAKVRAYRCTACNGDDVYGPMYHEETCPLYVPQDGAA